MKYYEEKIIKKIIKKNIKKNQVGKWKNIQ